MISSLFNGSRSMLTLCLSLAFVASGVRANAAPPDPMGTPPPVVASDYDAYFGNGNADLIIRPAYTLPDGTTTKCMPGNNDEAMLYPSTAFTRWLIKDWIAYLEHHPIFVNHDYPGDAQRAILPPYLRLTNTDSPTVVRTATCNKKHEFIFRHLPIGQYALVTEHNNKVESSRERPGYVQVTTPTGPEGYLTDQGTVASGYYTDGFLFYSDVDVAVPKADMYALPDDFLKTVAHYPFVR